MDKRIDSDENPLKLKQGEPTVQAVDRAIVLLKLVSMSEHPIPINDLAKQAHINRTTAWRLLSTLEHHGLVERDALTKGYRLGLAAGQLTSVTSSNELLSLRARPMMEKLAETTQETVMLSVPKNFGVVAISQIDPPHSVRLIDYVDVVLPLHCTSNGKLLLANLPKAEVEHFFDRPLEKRTTRTMTDPLELKKQLNTIRKNGFALSIGELDESENGISAPIYDANGVLIAFISVSGPAFRFTEDRAIQIAQNVVKTAVEISNALKQ
ncbi:IclR family transcriptional regulator [Alicyclobacillus fastidiosus]|uniref:IclR family transcriptional regulator n=1 Tax=Alicyclobacillus fastidiosus TaxID=392011 RepID=A0ABV5AEK3_9BACL|nr:IclR family transcriptional regulator [Alicyclobacillus fastidiosus]WEH09756.1 IclR family transcriptional regulator [Alicyclobacillus fastidiosus]